MARILIVDDEPTVRAPLKRLLEQEGHAVQTAGDGDAALEAIYTSPPFDLVLLDLHMPRFDGWDFLRMKRMSRRLEQTAVVLVTGACVENMDDLRGAAMIFEKPIDFALLLQTIGSCTRKTDPPPSLSAPDPQTS